MAETAPPGNPLSLPQRSRIYCEIIRSGSIACAGVTKHNKATPANTHWRSRCISKSLSWKILELLNDNLSLFLERILITGHDVQHELEELFAWRRYSGRKNMLENHRCS